MLNTVVIMGRLTADPELRTTTSGLSVTSFTVAVDRKGTEKKTDFIDCTAWRKTADFVSTYFKKGQMIAVEGSIQTDNFTDKDGNKRKSVQVTVENVSFCGSKNESQDKPQNAEPTVETPSFSVLPDSSASFSADDDEGLPF